MQLVLGRDDQIAEWVADRLGIKIAPPFVAIGAARGGQLCAGAVFNNWNDFNLEIHVYAPRALSRAALDAVFRYAFRQAGALRLTAMTRRTNKAARKLLDDLGFEFEGTSKRFFGPRKGDDGMRYAMFHEQAMKWMR